MAERRRRAVTGAAFTVVAAAIALGVAPQGFMDRAAAYDATERRVAIVWLDGMSLEDWSRSGGTALREILDDGSVGVLHTWPADGDPTEAAREAGANPGRRVRALRTGGARTGLGEVLADAQRAIGIVATHPATPELLRAFSLVGPKTLRPPGLSTGHSIPDATSPIGARTDVQAMAVEMLRIAPESGVLVADISDGALLDAALVDQPSLRDRWIARVLSRAEIVVKAARTAVGEDGIVMIISAPGPRGSEARSEHLGAIAVAGPLFPAGLLRSSTTRIPGLVSLLDIAPTVLTAAGLQPDASMTGAVLRVERGADAGGRARRLERDLTAAARARPQVALILFGALAFACVLTMSLFLGRRGRAPRGSAPIHLRDVALIMFAACLVAPLVLMVERTWRAVAVSIAVAIIARIAIGARWCVPALASLGVAPLAWTLIAPMSSAGAAVSGSIAAFLPPGRNPAVVGGALAALFVLLGSWSDGRGGRMGRQGSEPTHRLTWGTHRQVPRLRIGVALVAVSAMVVAAEDVRMVGIAGASLAWFIARDAGWSPPRTLIAFAAGGVLIFAGIAVLDSTLVYPADVRIWLDDQAARLDVVGVAAFAGLPLLVAAWRRRDEAARATFGSPGLRGAVGASVIAAIGIAIAYPGGASSAAWTLLPAVAVTGAFLTGSRSTAAP